MTDLETNLFGGIFLYIILVLTLNKFKKTKIKNIIISIIILNIICTPLNTYIDNTISIPLTFIILVIINNYIFKEKVKDNTISIFYIMVLLFNSELLVSLIFYLLKLNIDKNQIRLILYISICITYIIMFKILEKLNAFEKARIKLKMLSEGKLIINFAILTTISSLLSSVVLIKKPKTIIILTNTLLLLMFIYITSQISKAEKNYYEMKYKYLLTLKSLDEYEEQLDDLIIDRHENKNRLKTIKTMVESKHDPSNYINTLIKDKKTRSKKAKEKCLQIPNNILRASISTKLDEMKDKKIKYYLNISNEVKTSTLLKINTKTIANINDLINIFIDNSIDYVQNKNIPIYIEFYILNDELNIDISNKVTKLDPTKINKKGYTTKGKEHGYGLTLANKIVKRNKKIKHISILQDNIFTQKLIIKLN